LDFILFLLLFSSAFLYLDLQFMARFKIEENRKSRSKIEEKIEGNPEGGWLVTPYVYAQQCLPGKRVASPCVPAAAIA
jgi:hypothetical protein